MTKTSMIFALFLAGCATKQNTPSSITDVPTDAKPSVGNIYSVPAKINFGQVKVGSKHKNSFLIFNQAPRDVDKNTLGGLSEMGDSAQFQIDDSACANIKQGSACKVKVTYTPTAPGHHYLTIKTMGRITNIKTQLVGDAR
jgi:hypothetical protein